MHRPLPFNGGLALTNAMMDQKIFHAGPWLELASYIAIATETTNILLAFYNLLNVLKVLEFWYLVLNDK